MVAADKRKITFSFDLEDHRPQTPQGHRLEKRFPDNTRRVLEFLDERYIRGTFFTVGKLTKADAGLIREVAAHNHEIACHSWNHTPIALQTPDSFRKHSKDAKEALEDVVQKPVIGYRAPVFSLTQNTIWAADILNDLGFQYSSSVLPVKSPLYGFIDAPQSAFKWPCGLLELPAPIAKVGPVVVPYLGGIYFRYLPLSLVRRCLADSEPDAPLWHYSHPYDYDSDERYFRLNGASHPVSFALWFKRRGTFAKLAALADHPDMPGFDVPFAEQLERAEMQNAPVWSGAEAYTTAE